MNMTAQELWNKEQQMALDYQKINNKEFKHKVFINFVDLKRSFIDEAKDMVAWINKELKRKRPEVLDHFYFMDQGYLDHKPDRYKYRSAVFNNLKELIVDQQDHDPDVYEIVQKWDMWYHS
tara:strand:- start:253 stop:615 length:363 start_codon:yes stop_codon:yes gene_type:complete